MHEMIYSQFYLIVFIISHYSLDAHTAESSFHFILKKYAHGKFINIIYLNVIK